MPKLTEHGEKGDLHVLENSREQCVDAIMNLDLKKIRNVAKILWRNIVAGRQILLCGCGGSAADAQHFAAELVGRYEMERRGYRAIALTTDTSCLTAIGNDYGFDHVFSRQVDALARQYDVLIAISTSGNSPSVINAVDKALTKGMTITALTGWNGEEKFEEAGVRKNSIIVAPSARTSRIQEIHGIAIHMICELLDKGELNL